MRITRKRIVMFLMLIPLTCVLCLGVLLTAAFARNQMRWGDDLTEIAAASQPGNYEVSLEHDGRARTYRLHLPPAYDGMTNLPLVIVLHGGGGNADISARMTSFDDKADAEGFVVAHPNGSGRLPNLVLTWNSGNCCGYALDHEVDDVGFLRALIESLLDELRINPDRVYVTGMSNGAMMSFAAACELDDLVAGVGPVVGALNWASCQPEHPVSLIMINGTDDRHVPYEGGTAGGRIAQRERIDTSVADAITFWTEHDACEKLSSTESGDLVIDEYTDCAQGSAVTLITVKGGGHAWYGGTSGRPFGGDSSDALSATDTIWEFFAAHPRQ